MPKMLITVNISQGFITWTDMARSLEDEAGANGAKKAKRDQFVPKHHHLHSFVATR